ncbi:MAG: EutN/CcmL family microcompartment protein [Myxococcota bacterium]
MYLGRVIGTVVAERKVAGLEGVKLLVVQPVDHAGKPVGEPQVAVDTAQAGRGDLCTLTGAREASLALDPSFVPVDAAIIGIVDAVEIATAALTKRSDP